MPRISHWFFAVSVLYAITGMLVGMHMGASMDFTLAPAHAHWNLLGWVGNSIYGVFYALSIAKVPKRLPSITFALHNLGVVVMIPFLALLLANGNDARYVPEIVVGEILVVSGMISFAIAVWIALMRTPKG